MQLEARKYLHDVLKAARLASDFTNGKSFGDYAVNALMRSAVERQLQIVGDALSALSKADPSVAAGISDYKRIIAFRNILVHAYAQVDHALVWDIVTAKIPILIREAEDLATEK